jgi:hypothetical protein
MILKSQITNEQKNKVFAFEAHSDFQKNPTHFILELFADWKQTIMSGSE